MSVVGDIFGAGGVATLLGKAIDKIWPDPNERAKAQVAILEAEQRGEFKVIDAQIEMARQQTDINKVEAASTNWFIAGWRPFVGWVCGASLAYAAIVSPFVQSFAAYAGLHFDLSLMPKIDVSMTHDLLLALLGVAGMRTFEKFKGVEGNR